MIIASIVGLVICVAAALSVRLLWHQSDWRQEQIYSLDRIGLFVDAVIAVSKRQGSGLPPSDLGDLAGDWERVRSELAERYTFRAWLDSGRLTHTVQDRQARALSTLARQQTDPLLAKLTKPSVGPLKPTLIAEIFDVLTLDLDDLASTRIRVIELTAPPESANPATRPTEPVTLLRA